MNSTIRFASVTMMTLCFVLVGTSLYSQKTNSWDLFAKTKFESKYNEELAEYVFYPKFTDDLKSLEGKEIILEGFYVPFAPEEGNYIILSKFPMSQCYFCGGGGPESITEVTFKDGRTRFQVDDLVTVKGKLKLNIDDMDHLNFIIVDAVIVRK
jgi:uncharacterized membrane protein YcgQ (UPF0703/DUF1980 family)